MEINPQQQAKKGWNQPQLTVYGPLEKITGQTVKYVGGYDGIIFQMPDGTQITAS
ncbi:MAG TPA: hypothetical protein VNP04_22285 [Alphaproteobacteria bacterium]|nr:hypothetical protein [Alphaproteobacteria bacterium]